MSALWGPGLQDAVDKEKGDRVGAVGGDWEVVDVDAWWRTAFSSVSWTYTSTDECGTNPRVAAPPFYEFSMTPLDLQEEDVSPNPELVGCQLVESVVGAYERDVGFGYVTFPEIDRKECGLPLPLNLSLTEEDVAARREVWREAVGDLLSPESLTSSMTGSDHSAESFPMPATPVSKASYANVLLKNVSPSSSVSDDLPATSTPSSKALNAFASSFVPSSEGLSSFTFPTLNPPNTSTTRLTTVKIKKDDQGFFSSDADTHHPLPTLFQEASPRRRTRMSKTREIIDRLRSKQAGDSECISHSPSPIFHDLSFIQPRLSVSEDGGDRDRESNLSTPSLDEEEDGWINVGVEVPAATKTKRRRDLFSALTRKRTDSTSSLHCQEDAVEEERRPHTTICASPNSDGWIQGLPAVDATPRPPSAPAAAASAPTPSITSSKPTQPHPMPSNNNKLPPKPPKLPKPPKSHTQRMSKPSHISMKSSSSTSTSSYRSSSVSPTYPTFPMGPAARPLAPGVPGLLNPMAAANAHPMASMMAVHPPVPVPVAAPHPQPIPVPFFFGHTPRAHYATSLPPMYGVGAPAPGGGAYMAAPPPAGYVPVMMGGPGMGRHHGMVGAGRYQR